MSFDTILDDEFQVTKPEELVPVTTLGRGSYGKVVLASTTKDGKEGLVAVKVVAKSRLKAKVHVEKAVSELKVMTEIKSRFLVRSVGAFRKSYVKEHLYQKANVKPLRN